MDGWIRIGWMDWDGLDGWMGSYQLKSVGVGLGYWITKYLPYAFYSSEQQA